MVNFKHKMSSSIRHIVCQVFSFLINVYGIDNKKQLLLGNGNNRVWLQERITKRDLHLISPPAAMSAKQVARKKNYYTQLNCKGCCLDLSPNSQK